MTVSREADTRFSTSKQLKSTTYGYFLMKKFFKNICKYLKRKKTKSVTLSLHGVYHDEFWSGVKLSDSAKRLLNRKEWLSLGKLSHVL